MTNERKHAPDPDRYDRIKRDVIIDGKNYGHLILASEIEPKEIEWLWWPYIPLGAASLLFGPGGMGKSHIAVDIVSRLTRGELLPGQTTAMPPQTVLMLSAEDDFDKVLVPRLIRAGADLSRVAFPPDPFVLNATGVKALEKLLANFDASVVFIDPIVHYIGSKVDMNKANEVRGAIGVFHQLAMKHNSAIILVGHSRKGTEGADYEKAMGSADFNNAVRSVMYVSPTPDGLGKVMKHVKANYAALGPSLGYRFGYNGPGSFEWTGEVEPADMNGPPAMARRKARKTMVDFLRSWLANGPVPSKEIEQLGADEGFHPRTLDRAKIEAGAESFMVWRAGKPVWYMRLHGDETEIPRVDDAEPDGTGRHTVVRPVDGGEVHTGSTGEDAPADRPVGAGGSVDAGASDDAARTRAIVAAFLAKNSGGPVNE